MPASNYETDLALLCDVAREAGALSLRYWKTAPKAWEKAGGAGPVSVADLAVNDLIAEKLRPARPDYGWLSEESRDDPARLAAKRIFIVDPIDGTRAFLREDPGFAQALAVAENGRIVAAVVSLPALGKIYTATVNGPARCDGSEIRTGSASRIEDSTVLTSPLSENPAQWNGPVPKLRRALRPSLAWRLCLVAEGSFDATISLRPAWEWDIAAASLIADRAGALATDRKGRELRFNSPTAQADGLVVAPPVLHADYISRIRPIVGH